MQRALQAPAGSFGSAIYVPTPDGFSDAPGCVESYAATATFRLYTKGDKAEGDGVTRPLILREEVEFKVGGKEQKGQASDHGVSSSCFVLPSILRPLIKLWRRAEGDGATGPLVLREDVDFR